MNVTALVKVVSGSARVVERYAYDPYGRPTVLNGEAGHDADGQVAEWSADADGRSDWGNAVLFAGYRHDAETGLYAVRHRTLHPHLGWLQRDPLGYVDGTSLYEYCASAPVSATDSMGPELKFIGPDPLKKDAQNIYGKAKQAATREVKKKLEKIEKGPRAGEIKVDYNRADIDAGHFDGQIIDINNINALRGHLRRLINICYWCARGDSNTRPAV